MDKKLYVSLLLEVYSAVLSEKQRQVVSHYFNDDLSLGEIAANIGITRQAVFDMIKRTESLLYRLEDEMKLLARFEELRVCIESISENAQEILKTEAGASTKENALEIIETAKSMQDMI